MLTVLLFVCSHLAKKEQVGIYTFCFSFSLKWAFPSVFYIVDYAERSGNTNISMSYVIAFLSNFYPKAPNSNKQAKLFIKVLKSCHYMLVALYNINIC